ncbi:MAG: rhodanese-like domain-containing protein [Acidimicrobiales bacterium]
MSIQEVSVDALAEALERGDRVIDVRETDEYVGGHVPGAVHVALGTVPDHVDAFRSPEGVTTYVICRSGARSMKAAQFLAEQGVETVNVAGGTMAWIQSGRPAVTGDQPS